MDDGRSAVPALPAAQREAARRGTLAKDKMLSKPLSEVSAEGATWDGAAWDGSVPSLLCL